MAQVKYYYDPRTLSYKKIQVRALVRYRRVFTFLLASAVFGLLGLVVLLNTTIVNTPKELSLQREVENFKVQYSLLQKKMEQAQKVLANIEERDNTIYRVYFETAPISESQRKAGFGGINRYQIYEGYEHSDLIAETAKKMDILQKQLVVQSKSLDEITALASEKETLLASIPAIQPLSNEKMTRIASGYGYRSDPFSKTRKMHWGMDFTAPKGTPIYAPGDGKVVRADNRSSGYGNHIRIAHGFGYETLYGHLNKYNVRVGQRVKRGDLIGYVGNTGRSEAPHLHYEVWKDRKKINPINFYYGSLTPEEFQSMLRYASQENQSLD
ncbi:M23 family metallopeptidase [Flavobacteriaceae bacterium]|jgi:murein DD-endopeptidase MepM/ murein hydrolase activator NlpD|nr:M23 family metallopeptidase [Flavobacteriaceae bacterium]HCD22435.1 peptidase M23 [Flavobacteriaceae bacterium]